MIGFYKLRRDDLRRLSFRDALQMMMAAVDEAKREKQNAALVATAVHNWGGMRGEGFRAKTEDELFPRLYGKSTSAGTLSAREMAEANRRHLERLAHEQAVKGVA